MKIEILHIEACPNWREAGERVGAALATVGADADAVEYRLITESAALDDLPFAGSPTILGDGRDLFPTDGATRDLACRVYVSHGRLAGVPALDELVAALRQRDGSNAEG